MAEYYVVDRGIAFFITHCPILTVVLEKLEEKDGTLDSVDLALFKEYPCSKNRYGFWEDFENKDMTVKEIFEKCQ